MLDQFTSLDVPSILHEIKRNNFAKGHDVSGSVSERALVKGLCCW